MSRWRLIRLLLFGEHWGTGYSCEKGDTSFSMKYCGLWYSVRVSKGGML